MRQSRCLEHKEHEKPKQVRALRLDLQVDLITRIKESHKLALQEPNLKKEGLGGMIDQLIKGNDGILRMNKRIWVPVYGNTPEEILEEAHKSKYTMYPGSDKMYKNLKDNYRWIGMKKHIAIYVAKCLTCSQVKAEHQKLTGLQQLEILVWKL
ncbi:hypothetical protein L1987_38192 [Smallanthus sonchifolius]|uniref:Uncharacterized protein n=1 Tax=Smallanthus sonchifolius TaxID=185202 RepID=A0ACB9HL15_9ASTR|nr:hypothetical protein L1987_38192 [Smallanthus sonchifolius]